MRAEATHEKVNSRSEVALLHLRSRIEETARAVAARPVVIVALGDSVTAGENEFDVYHAQLRIFLEERFSQSRFKVVNAGVSGDSAIHGLLRLESDVLALRPDLVIIGFGLNDSDGGHLEGLPLFASNITQLVRRTRNAAVADIILLSPNMMLTRYNDSIPAESAHMTDRFLHLQNEGVLAAYARQIADVARTEGVVFADVYRRWEELAASGIDTTALLANGLNHPNAEGSRIAAGAIMSAIDSQF